MDSDLDVVVLNHGRKLLFCALPKSGSRSWLTYLANMTGNASEPWRVRNEDFMMAAGLDYRKKVPVREVVEKFGSYTKFTVVRHPIQWIVALYFETVHILDKYRNPDGSRPTLQQFVANLYHYPKFKKYWESFELSCHHCLVRYDYIVKAETVDPEGDSLRNFLHTDVVPPFVHVNPRYGSVADRFKYDEILREMERNSTSTIHRLLAYYEKDLRMFGYAWDVTGRRSTCHNDDEHGTCC